MPFYLHLLRNRGIKLLFTFSLTKVTTMQPKATYTTCPSAYQKVLFDVSLTHPMGNTDVLLRTHACTLVMVICINRWVERFISRRFLEFLEKPFMTHSLALGNGFSNHLISDNYQMSQIYQIFPIAHLRPGFQDFSC